MNTQNQGKGRDHLDCPRCGSKMKSFSKEDICTNPDCKFIRWKKGEDLSIKEINTKGSYLDEGITQKTEQ